MLIYRGPSQIDQSPILALLTGIDRQCKNVKTGPMAQLWIVPELLSPLQAIATGADFAVCGWCRHRHANANTCYVVVAQGPQSAWKKWKRGGHLKVSPKHANAILRRKALAVRLGAWGDPAALPYAVLAQLTDGVTHTGYTHQAPAGPGYRDLLMASVDTPAEQARAVADGWRTFRVRLPGEPLMPGEITCPASAEAGHRTTCERCALCSGNSLPARNVVIQIHGNALRVLRITK